MFITILVLVSIWGSTASGWGWVMVMMNISGQPPCCLSSFLPPSNCHAHSPLCSHCLINQWRHYLLELGPSCVGVGLAPSSWWWLYVHGCIWGCRLMWAWTWWLCSLLYWGLSHFGLVTFEAGHVYDSWVVFASLVQSSFFPPKWATIDHNQSRTDPDIVGTEPDHLGPVFCSPWNWFRPVQTGFFV